MKSSTPAKLLGLLLALTFATPLRAQAPARPASALAVSAENRTALDAAARGAAIGRRGPPARASHDGAVMTRAQLAQWAPTLASLVRNDRLGMRRRFRLQLHFTRTRIQKYRDAPAASAPARLAVTVPAPGTNVQPTASPVAVL